MRSSTRITPWYKRFSRTEPRPLPFVPQFCELGCPRRTQGCVRRGLHLHVTKLFYTLLYASTAALAVTLWVQHDDQGELLELVGSRAHAQSPDPLTPWARDPAAIPGSGGGMISVRGIGARCNPVSSGSELAAAERITPKPRKPAK